MIVVHFVTLALPPVPGGLEQAVANLATAFVEEGARVVIHVRLRQHPSPDVSRLSPEIQIEWIGKGAELLEEPLVRSDAGYAALRTERWRVEYLLLRASVARQVQQYPSATHVLVSTFVTKEGVLASSVATALGLPHVPCVVGSDFSVGFYEPTGRAVFEGVVSSAAAIVTWNREQERVLARTFPGIRLRTIHTSINPAALDYQWHRPESDHPIRFFSDTGYSHKKGSQILLAAFAALRARRVEAHLVLCGPTIQGHEVYWSGVRARYTDLLGDSVTFLDNMALPFVWQTIATSHCYLSATLGEGSSLARAAALSIGCPIVTTRCGEVVDVADSSGHVRLVEPGDASAFTEALAQLCDDFHHDRIALDATTVAFARKHFSRAREKAEWIEVLEAIAGASPLPPSDTT